ncbi:hypothetical protein LHFGNBLO_004410 [Mesorhizobium sp. AR10]|uniref:HEPN domain-containing protein n=1 Tax=Mesorhizobium sp. AR10 TaxID=2865839 RepID=UPI002160AD13|nr:HEPN domain-containing protein [Mesorhizobium sp. AR10]UVK37386.1 hypothetical protein LHFGNBLO_004410 [Mesorhizobium sp. AR10]
MAIELHESVQRKLRPALADGLKAVRINNRKFIDYSSTYHLDDIDKILPQGQVQKSVASMLGEPKISDFALDHVSRTLFPNEYDPDSKAVPLQELLPPETISGLANEVVDDLARLPHNYIISISLPATFGDGVKSSGFEGNASGLPNAPRLAKVDKNFQSVFKLRSELEPQGLLSLMNGEPRNFIDDAICLQFSMSGYVDRHGTSLTASHALDTIRSFFGIGLALATFILEGSFSSWWAPSQRVVVHRILDDGTLYHDTNFEISREVSDLISRIRLMSDGVNPPSEKALNWSLAQITRVWESGSRADQIRRSASWHFDSYAGSNQLLSFIQAMTVVEILVGEQDPDEKGIGLTKLLSNRCAYLLGATRDERDALLRRFSEIYRVRSQIVHVGKSRLIGSEERMLFELRSICRRLIWKEIEMLRSPNERIARALIGG